MEILANKPGILALRFAGRLLGDDVVKAYDLVEEALSSERKLHLFVEVADLRAIEIEAIAKDLTRGLGLLRELERFGRVAIVSDQSWVRWLARTESAILPGISYRTYKLAERDQALAWVEGGEEFPYGKAITLIKTNRPEVLGIEVNGRLSKEEIAAISRELNATRHAQNITSVLVRIRAFDGFDPSMVLDGEYVRMKLGFLRELDRYAIVGGPKWIKQWAELLGPLVRIETRYFASEAEAAAWQWLGAEPASEPALAA